MVISLLLKGATSALKLPLICLALTVVASLGLVFISTIKAAGAADVQLSMMARVVEKNKEAFDRYEEMVAAADAEEIALESHAHALLEELGALRDRLATMPADGVGQQCPMDCVFLPLHEGGS